MGWSSRPMTCHTLLRPAWQDTTSAVQSEGGSPGAVCHAFPLKPLPAIGTLTTGSRRSSWTRASSDALVLLQVMATHGKQITAAALKDMVYTEAVVRLAESWLHFVVACTLLFLCMACAPAFTPQVSLAVT